MVETTQQVSNPLFSAEERRNLVRSFIWSYVTGAVTIIFPSNIGDQADQVKTSITTLMRTSFGTHQGTSEEIDQAIDFLFTVIVSARHGGRIKGNFVLTPDVESRLTTLENAVASIQRLFEELQQRLKVQGSQQ